MVGQDDEKNEEGAEEINEGLIRRVICVSLIELCRNSDRNDDVSSRLEPESGFLLFVVVCESDDEQITVFSRNVISAIPQSGPPDADSESSQANLIWKYENKDERENWAGDAEMEIGRNWTSRSPAMKANWMCNLEEKGRCWLDRKTI